MNSFIFYLYLYIYNICIFIFYDIVVLDKVLIILVGAFPIGLKTVKFLYFEVFLKYFYLNI